MDLNEAGRQLFAWTMMGAIVVVFGLIFIGILTSRRWFIFSLAMSVLLTGGWIWLNWEVAAETAKFFLQSGYWIIFPLSLFMGLLVGIIWYCAGRWAMEVVGDG